MKLAAIASALCLLVLANAGAQENRSLTNSGNQAPQVITGGTPSSGPASSSDDDSDAPVYERLVLAQNTIKELTQSLANANAEAETYKRQASDLSLKLQALGIAGVEKNGDKIEQRLLAAVRDLRLAKQQNEDYRAELIQLSEAVMALLKATESIAPENRMAVETELRRTGELIGSPQGAAPAEAVEATLQDAMVVDVRDELSLVVANVGEKQGAKIGMPFQVWRDGKKIGAVRVVDVRDRISGAVIQNLENPKNPVKAGDRLRVDAQQ
jgi:hypothetical protein